MLYVRFETYFMSYSNRTLVLNTGTIFDYQCSTSPSTEWCIRNVAMIPLSENKNGINGCIETYFVSGSQEITRKKAKKDHRSYCRCRDRYLVSEYLIWFQDQPPATYSNETWYLVRYTAEYQDSMKQIKSSTTTFPLCIWNATNRINPNWLIVTRNATYLFYLPSLQTSNLLYTVSYGVPFVSKLIQIARTL